MGVVAAGSVLVTVVAVPGDEVAGVLWWVEEAMLGDAREGEDGRAQQMW